MSEDMSIDLESDTLTETTLAWYLHLFISLTQTFNTMKKTFYFLALAAVLALTSGCNRDRSILYAMGNQTDKEITVYPPYGKMATTLSPGQYFGISIYPLYPDGPVVEALYDNSPFYISIDGVKYQVDRNQRDNCLWTYNYHEAPEAIADSLRDYKGELIWVYYLTEDYIKRQIVVNE